MKPFIILPFSCKNKLATLWKLLNPFSPVYRFIRKCESVFISKCSLSPVWKINPFQVKRLFIRKDMQNKGSYQPRAVFYESQRWNQASESPCDWSVARFDNFVTGSNKWIMCVQYIILRIIVKITQIGVFDTPRMKIEIPKSDKSKNSATSQQK